MATCPIHLLQYFVALIVSVEGMLRRFLVEPHSVIDQKNYEDYKEMEGNRRFTPAEVHMG